MLRLAADADRVEIPADREEIGQIRGVEDREFASPPPGYRSFARKARAGRKPPSVFRVQPQLDHSQHTKAAARQDRAGIISHEFIVARGSAATASYVLC